jgi:thioredoxin reductase
MKESPPLIAGAGPVGLGAALYLAQANIMTRNPIWRVISPQKNSIDEIDDVKHVIRRERS